MSGPSPRRDSQFARFRSKLTLTFLEPDTSTVLTFAMSPATGAVKNLHLALQAAASLIDQNSVRTEVR